MQSYRGLALCRQTVWLVIKHFEKYGHIPPLPRSGQPSKLSDEILEAKGLAWALANKDEIFEDVILTDETSVQLETHRRFCCRKKG